nr:hypothetical protein [Mucilaginibacter sp. E4BP6]
MPFSYPLSIVYVDLWFLLYQITNTINVYQHLTIEIAFFCNFVLQFKKQQCLKILNTLNA